MLTSALATYALPRFAAMLRMPAPRRQGGVGGDEDGDEDGDRDANGDGSEGHRPPGRQASGTSGKRNKGKGGVNKRTDKGEGGGSKGGKGGAGGGGAEGGVAIDSEAVAKEAEAMSSTLAAAIATHAWNGRWINRAWLGTYTNGRIKTGLLGHCLHFATSSTRTLRGVHRTCR